MLRIGVFAFLSLCLIKPLAAQNYKSVLSALEKGKYEKAKAKIDGFLDRYPDDAGAHYLLAAYHLDSLSPSGIQLDTAHRNLVRAKSNWLIQPEKLRAKQAKAGIDLAAISTLRAEIDRRAFERASRLNTEEAYHFFLLTFTEAEQEDRAIERRDSLGFWNASRVNTWQAYESFFLRYPEAKQVPVAKERYHVLLYQDQTRLDTREDLIRFIEHFPESPFLPKAEERFFRLFCADHHPTTYQQFLSSYTQSSMASHALFMLWQLTAHKDSLLQAMPQLASKAYVKAWQKSQQGSYIAFFEPEAQAYGLLDMRGKVVLAAGLSAVDGKQLCDGVEEPYVLARQQDKWGAVDLNGEIVVPFAYELLEPFSPGVLRFRQKGKYGLVSFNGYELVPANYERLMPLGQKLVKAKLPQTEWGILTYYGQTVLAHRYEYIYTEHESLIEIGFNDRYAYQTPEALLARLQGTPEPLRFDYDFYELSHEHFLLLGYKDSLFRLQHLHTGEVLVNGVKDIRETLEGWVFTPDTGFTILRKDGRRVSPVDYQAVISGRSGYGVKVQDRWGVINFEGEMFIQPLYDTLFFVGDKGILLERAGKSFGYFGHEELTDLSAFERLLIQSAMVPVDSATSQEMTFIVATDKRKQKGLLSDRGEMVIPARYADLSLTPDGLVIVERNRKKGLLDLSGNTLLAAKYDGIVRLSEGRYALLAGKKFGMFFMPDRQTIEPVYDAILQPYGYSDTLFIAKKGGLGIIDRQGQAKTPFDFQRLRYWTDSVALVNVQDKWQLLNMKSGYLVGEAFDELEVIFEGPAETVIKTYRSSGFGALSSVFGRFIYEEYTAIRQLGSTAEPLYLVEKDVAQANIHVIIYLDREGKTLKKTVLESNEYEKIACQFE